MIDINTKLGLWPYRPVKWLSELLLTMDARGIERAAVSSLNSVFYLNPQDGNDQLASWVEPHRDRLIPFAVLKPGFAGWQEDLAVCLDDHEMRGVVLYPNYHRFDLDHPELSHLMEEAESGSLPVCVQAGLEDVRRQFDRERVPDVDPVSIGAFARKYPGVTVLALGLKFGQPEQVGDPLPDNFYFDISNYETMGDIEWAVEKFGPDRILFGTGFPLFDPLANVNKLRLADIDDSTREAIGAENARRMLAIGELGT
jgi:predicted TIM-barrel fold metal-dependent hydrolase